MEGVWGSGKTNLAKMFCKKYDAILVNEPNHIKAGINNKNRAAVTNWYLRAHERNLKNGIKMLQKGKRVVIERSMLSSIIFSRIVLKQQNTGILFRRFEKHLKTARNSMLRPIHFIYLDIRDLKVVINKMRKNHHLEKFADPKFVKRFDQFLLKYLKILNKRKLIKFVRRSEINKFSKILK